MRIEFEIEKSRNFLYQYALVEIVEILQYTYRSLGSLIIKASKSSTQNNHCTNLRYITLKCEFIDFECCEKM